MFSLDKEIESEAGHQGNGFETPASTQVPSVFAGVFFRNTAGKVHWVVKLSSLAGPELPTLVKLPTGGHSLVVSN